MIKIFAVLLLVSMQTTAQKRDLFVGTYTRGESKGIYVYSFDQKTGEFKRAAGKRRDVTTCHTGLATRRQQYRYSSPGKSTCACYGIIS